MMPPVCLLISASSAEAADMFAVYPAVSFRDEIDPGCDASLLKELLSERCPFDFPFLLGGRPTADDFENK